MQGLENYLQFFSISNEGKRGHRECLEDWTWYLTKLKTLIHYFAFFVSMSVIRNIFCSLQLS